jgi:hypothetical protein
MGVTIDELKGDRAIDVDRDDDRLQLVLDAALAFASRVRADLNWAEESGSDLPDPSDDHWLGVLRLAGRWHQRRQTPDGIVQTNDQGSWRVPSVDPDVERLLGIGRYRGPVIA